jgi:hypothetical protein
MTDTVPRGTVTLADGSTFVLPIGHRKPLNANQVTYSRGGAIARNERVREFRKIVTARCREARIPAGRTTCHSPRGSPQPPVVARSYVASA